MQMTRRQFQFLALATFALYLVWFFLPVLGWTVTEESYAASRFYGAGAMPFTQHPFAQVAWVVSRAVVTIGLYCFFTWGRTLFGVWLAAGVVYSFFAGVLVSPPIDVGLGYASSLLDSALLVFAYSSGVAPLFRVDGTPAQPGVQGSTSPPSAEPRP